MRRPAAENKRAFLAAYRETGQITKAAEAAKVDRSAHRHWLKTDTTYKINFENAQEDVAELLEQEAIRRAKEGVLEPIFYQGIKVGVVRRYSDAVLMFLLRGFKPDKFSTKTEITGAGGGPLLIADAILASRQKRMEALEASGSSEDEPEPA